MLPRRYALDLFLSIFASYLNGNKRLRIARLRIVFRSQCNIRIKKKKNPRCTFPTTRLQNRLADKVGKSTTRPDRKEIIFEKIFSSVPVLFRLVRCSVGSSLEISDLSADTGAVVCTLLGIIFMHMDSTICEKRDWSPSSCPASPNFVSFSFGRDFYYYYLFPPPPRDRLLCRYGRCSVTDNK